MLCKSHKNECITTMFDYYAWPLDNIPDIYSQDTDIFKRMKQIEAAVNFDIGEPNCLFHFMLYEFEGILFSNPDSFSIIADYTVVRQIQKIKDAYPTVEHINCAKGDDTIEKIGKTYP